MRLPWFFGSRPARRRPGRRSGGKKFASAPLRVRQLERRRVLDAAAASLVEPALTTQETVVAAPVAGQETLVIDWLTAEESASESSAAASSFMAAAIGGGGISGDEGGIQAAGFVNNPPEVLAGFDQEINEGDFLDLSGSGGAPPLALILDDLGDTHTATVNWGDGTGDQPATVFPSGGFGSPVGGTHTYAEGDAPYTDYTVTITATDQFGASNSDTLIVRVHNVAPSVSIDTLGPISENDTLTFTGTYFDPGVQDSQTMIVDWDDPNNTTDSTFEIDALFNASGMQTLIEGETFNSTSDDAVLTIESIDLMTNEVSFSIQHQFLDDGLAPGNVTTSDTSTILVSMTDADGDSGDDSEDVAVQNVAPQLSDPLDVVILENGTAMLVTTLTDPGTLDVFSVDVNWLDGTSDAISGLGLSDVSGTVGGTMYTWVATTRELTVRHQYLDDDPTTTSQDDYEVLLTPHDDDSGTGDTQTAVVTVQNVAPSVSVAVGTPINENGTTVLSGTITDIGSLDTFTLDVTWGDSLSPDNVQSFMLGTVVLTQAADGIDWDPLTRTFSIQHQYLDDNPSVTSSDPYTITVDVTDDDSGMAVTQMPTVTVNNLPPSLMVGEPIFINEGDFLDLSGINGAPSAATFTDVGTLDMHRAQIDWGDGHVEEGMIVQGAGFGSIKGSHTYADDGVYEVIIRLADDDMSSFATPDNFDSGMANVDYVEITFDVTVSNLPQTETDTDPTDNTVSEGTAFVLSDLGGSLPNMGFGLADPGFDNPDNPNAPDPPQIIDTKQETFTGFMIDWGDGTADTPLTIVMRDSGEPTVATTALFQHDSHTYADDGVYTVHVYVADDNMSGNLMGVGGIDYTRLEFTITVTNANPTLTTPASVPTPAMISENGSVSFAIDFSDPGFDNPLNDNTPPNGGETDETFTYDIDWGDGRQELNNIAVAATPGAVGDPSAGSFGGSHIYADDGNYTVTVTIHDDDGGSNVQTFIVSVQNVAPSITLPLQGDEVNTDGITRIRFAFSDPGFDNPLNETPPPTGDQFLESFTYHVNWGDGTIDIITVTQVAPGSPLVVNSQTMVLSSARTSGNEGILTTGSFEVEHLYLGPPNPLNPTADIIITVTLIDDNGGMVQDTVAVGNPGIDTVNQAIDTTPQVPRIEFVAQPVVPVLLDQTTSSIQTLQSANGRIASGEIAVTSERYLELVAFSPDGKETGRYKLKEEALANLRALFATLPDGRYEIYLVRTETNSRRLVIDVYVRGGRVIDPSDDSEGTRDRPPTSESQQIQAAPIEENPFIVPADEAGAPDAAMRPVVQPATDISNDNVMPMPAVETKQVTARSLRWGAPLAGLALAAAGRGRWSDEVGSALEHADRTAWQRLRRAGRLRRALGRGGRGQATVNSNKSKVQ